MAGIPNNCITVYTDGACKYNPGPGGWAAILIWNGIERGISGRSTHTTNNEMELMALYQALKLLKGPSVLKIYSDSSYVVNSISKGWVLNWISKGELSRRPNGALWSNVMTELYKHQFEIHWVKGHHTNKYNNMCDKMAVRERDIAESQYR